jgi:hypothetical protein
MHDPIGQKHQSIPQLNLYIKEHIASFDIILDELPKNVVAISPISKTILYQHQTNEYKHTKNIQNPKVSTFINTNLTNYKGQDQTFNNQIIYTFKTITWENFKYVQHL